MLTEKHWETFEELVNLARRSELEQMYDRICHEIDISEVCIAEGMEVDE